MSSQGRDDRSGKYAPVTLDPRAVRLVVVDESDAIHDGIRAWCAEAEPPVRVVGAFQDPDALSAPSAGRAGGLDDVDVVVLDLVYDDGPPRFDVLRRLCRRACRVIVYSRLTADEIILTSLDLGATTYLVKKASRSHLMAAVYAVRSQTPYVGPQMAQALLNARALGRTNLSRRERQVLITWLQTDSKDLVAQRLGIAPATVRSHLERIRQKYEAVGRTAPTKSALLARAVEDGLLGFADLHPVGDDHELSA